MMEENLLKGNTATNDNRNKN